MGVGIVTRYRYMNQEDLPTLKTDIENQIATYLPMLQGVTVNLSISDRDEKELQLEIQTDDVLYTFETDMENNTLKLSNF